MFALAQGFAGADINLFFADVGANGGDANAFAAHHAVVGHRLVGFGFRHQRREILVAGDGLAIGSAHHEEHRIEMIDTQDFFGLGGQIELQIAAKLRDLRNQCPQGISQALIERGLGRNPGQTIGQSGTYQIDRQQRRDQPFEQGDPDTLHAAGTFSSI